MKIFHSFLSLAFCIITFFYSCSTTAIVEIEKLTSEQSFYSDLASVASSEYCNFFHQGTKSDGAPEVDVCHIFPFGQDSSMYVVNFVGNRGFAVISSDVNAPVSYVISDSGFCDGNTTGNQSFDYCLSLLKSQDIESVSFSSKTKAPLQIQRQYDTTCFENEQSEPLCSVEWHQEAPFNNLCPEYFGVHFPAGCVPIAIAQAMSCFEYPEMLMLHSDNQITYTDLDWSAMKNSLHSHYHSDSCQACQMNALLLREIGYLCGAFYSSEVTTAYFSDALYALYLLDYISSDVSQYDIDNLFDSRSLGYPSLIDAREPNRVGHTWLVDGTMHSRMRRNIFKRTVSGAFEGVWMDDGYEYDEKWYLHFNYGYGGANNVYFLAKRRYHGEGSSFVSGSASISVDVFSGGNPEVMNDDISIITHIHPCQ